MSVRPPVRSSVLPSVCPSVSIKEKPPGDASYCPPGLVIVIFTVVVIVVVIMVVIVMVVVMVVVVVVIAVDVVFDGDGVVAVVSAAAVFFSVANYEVYIIFCNDQ